MSVKEIMAALDAGAPSIGTARLPKKRAKKKKPVLADRESAANAARVNRVRRLLKTLTPFEAGLAFYVFENDPSSATMSGEAALDSMRMMVSSASRMLESSASFAAKGKVLDELERLRKAIVWANTAANQARATVHLR